METFGNMMTELFKVWSAMWGAIWAVLPRAILFCLWILSAIIILPCVFVSGVLYPKWVEWGEDL
ncbi:MAG: hypothetical protein AAB777_02760 [Patescibacteria group bacterium]